MLIQSIDDPLLVGPRTPVGGFHTSFTGVLLNGSGEPLDQHPITAVGHLPTQLEFKWLGDRQGRDRRLISRAAKDGFADRVKHPTRHELKDRLRS